MLRLPCKEDWAGPLGDERKVGQLALLVGDVPTARHTIESIQDNPVSRQLTNRL